MPSFSQFIVWIVVGLLGGSLAGLIITWALVGSLIVLGAFWLWRRYGKS
jgi:hypothetical protein